MRRYFRDGRLHVTMSSSVLRSQLYFQRDALLEKMNALLRDDGLLAASSGRVYVKELILK